ncbi:MAG: transglycosylase SLT domain-containing protein [Chloroflexota bacterium]|nr:transglycosylase SLT domain-containing protein [Chloroflexota bacterium]
MRAADLDQPSDAFRRGVRVAGVPVGRRFVTAKGPTRRRARRITSRKRRGQFLRRPLLFGSVVFLVLVAIAGIGAHTVVDGGRPLVPASAPFRYTIVAGDTVGSVSSLFAASPTDMASRAGGTLTPGSGLTVDAARLWRRMRSDPFGGNELLVEQGARKVGIHPSLALAVAWQESRLQQDARSSTGAVGIMQVEPDTSKLASRDLGLLIDPTIATDNVMAGLFWLHSLLASYDNDEESALAAYYEGPGNLRRRGYLVGTAEYVAHVRQIQSALLIANPDLDA